MLVDTESKEPVKLVIGRVLFCSMMDVDGTVMIRHLMSTLRDMKECLCVLRECRVLVQTEKESLVTLI